MATIRITPPEGWRNPKHAQTIVNHLEKHGARMTLELDEAGRQVVAAKVVLPRNPAQQDESEGADKRRKQIAQIRQYIREYGWKEE